MLTTEFKPLRILGQGGFGETTLVEIEGDRHVLKRLKPSAIKDHGQMAIELFLKESQYLKELGNHPQIPALVDSGVDEDGPWILQEYIPGQNLEQLIEEQGSFSEAEIISLLKSLLPVLKLIHDHHTIHRDVKPANIIFHQDRHYLVDFGASKRVSETVLRKTGTTIGSAGYAAPEQTMGKAGFSSDLYSLGVTCIYLLSAIQPFDLFDMSIGGWNWRGSLPKDKLVSEGLGQILDQMLEQGTYRRYQSADQVLEALKNIDRGQIERRRLDREHKDRRHRLAMVWGRRVAIGGGVAALIVAGGYGLTQLVHMIHLPEMKLPEANLPKINLPKEDNLPGSVGTVVFLLKVFSYLFLVNTILMSYKMHQAEHEHFLRPIEVGGIFFLTTNFMIPQVLSKFVTILNSTQ
jgi:serine/threonine protein kinase